MTRQGRHEERLIAAAEAAMDREPVAATTVSKTTWHTGATPEELKRLRELCS